MSGAAEDLLAAFLDHHLRNYDEILIDQPISFRGTDKRTHYVDIALLRHGELRRIIDVKTDLGYMRKAAKEFFRGRSEFIRTIRRKRRGYIGKLNQEIHVAPHCTCHFVVLSGRNIQAENLRRWEDVAQNREYSSIISMYILSGRRKGSLHPNEWPDDAPIKNLGKLDIQEPTFSKLLADLR